MDGDTNILCVHWSLATPYVCDLYSYQQSVVQGMYLELNSLMLDCISHKCILGDSTCSWRSLEGAKAHS